jgi:hypothetical protein
MDSRIDPARIPDILELQRLKALYFYNLDQKNWDGWGSLFFEKARFSVERKGEGGQTVDVVEGIANIIEWVKERVAVVPTVHHGHTPLFEFTSNVEASGVWAMADILYYGDGRTVYGYGHYRESYRKDAGVWKIASLYLTRLKVDVVIRES